MSASVNLSESGIGLGDFARTLSSIEVCRLWGLRSLSGVSGNGIFRDPSSPRLLNLPTLEFPSTFPQSTLLKLNMAWRKIAFLKIRTQLNIGGFDRPHQRQWGYLFHSLGVFACLFLFVRFSDV